jgi:hypothetical protein
MYTPYCDIIVPGRVKIIFPISSYQSVKWYIENTDWLENITSGEYEKYYKEMYSSKINWFLVDFSG